MAEKLYHIYVKDKCLYHCLNEEEFDKTWRTLNYFLEIATELDKKDLQYEEVIVQNTQD